MLAALRTAKSRTSKVPTGMSSTTCRQKPSSSTSSSARSKARKARAVGIRRSGSSSPSGESPISARTRSGSPPARRTAWSKTRRTIAESVPATHRCYPRSAPAVILQAAAMPAISRAVPSTVASLFAARARVVPSARALIDDRVSWSYGELAERVARLAGVLRARGLVPGDRVAILSHNRAEYLELFLAAAWLGAVVACQNWRLSGGELAHCLDLVEPALLVASPEEAARLAGRREPLLALGDNHE